MVTVLPPDGHVHSQWSWDAVRGDMEATCARAVALGLPSLAFTEHADFTTWTMPPDGGTLASQRPHRQVSGTEFHPPAFDASGYFAELDRCRTLFPDLRIRSGVEIGEPHWNPVNTAELLAAGDYERVVGSQHSLRVEGGRLIDVRDGYRSQPAPDAFRAYLAAVTELAASDAPFEVLAHIDYAARAWPHASEPFEPLAFEDEFREALRTLATSGRALEVNTRRPMEPVLVQWWYDVGGDALTFGSDAHDPPAVAHGLAEAAELATAIGFRASTRLDEMWGRD